MKQIKSFNLMVIGLLLLTGALAAQQTTARIVGAVQLEDGSLLPGVLVEATSPSLVGKSTSRTDENGAFRLAGLAPGTYRVTFSSEGFQAMVRENIPLQVEQTITLRITMQIGGITEALTVTGQIPLIDVKSTAKGMTMNRDMFQSLPKGRNFDGLMAVIPGIVNENFLGGISIDGSSAGENTFYIDGQNTNSIYASSGVQNVAFDFIDEVQVKASGYQAEFGGSLGGVINVVTRSGGNEFHGDVTGYYSGSALQGTERDTTTLNPNISEPTLFAFNYTKDFGQAMKESRIEGGFGLGGYIIKDKVWFYVNALPVFQKTTVPAIFLVTADANHIASDPVNGVINTYDYSKEKTDLNFQAKISIHPARNLRLSMSFVNNYNAWKGDLPNRNGGSSDSFDWTGLGYGFPNYSFSGNFDYSIGNNFMISGRVGQFHWAKKNQLDPSMENTDRAPLYLMMRGNTTISSVPASLRRPTGWRNIPMQAMTYPHEVDRESNLSAGLDFSYFLNLAGEHAWKAGVAYARVSSEVNTLWNAPYVLFRAWRDTPSFRADIEVYGGQSSRDHDGFGKQYGVFGKAASYRLALYLQDSWTIANKLTINAGLRAEAETLPSFNDDPAWAEYIGRDVLRFGLLDKISPRLGFIYDVLGDSSFKVYGSYGLYNDVMEFDIALGAFGGGRVVSDRYFLNDPNEIFNVYRLLPDGSRDTSMLTWRFSTNYMYQSWGLIDPNLKPMSQSEITLGVDKKLRDDLSFSVRGVWRQLNRAIDDIGILVPNPEGGFDEVFYVGNPGYGISLPTSQGGLMSDDFWPTPKAQRDYQALNISLEKRMGNHWLGGLSLTLSRLWGNYSGIVSSDEVNQIGTGFGRFASNGSRYFDCWWMSYDASGTQKVNNGLLPTDRPVVAKAYGSYMFPFGLTVGAVVNWMSGTPKSTEFFIDTMAGYYPQGRGDLGRTPDLWFLNLYAEYNLTLGKNTLQFSVNVDNATNNDAAVWYWTRVNNSTVYTFWNYPGLSTIDPAFPDAIFHGYDYLAYEGSWPQDAFHWTRDPRFNKALQFQLPIAARFGVKFNF